MSLCWAPIAPKGGGAYSRGGKWDHVISSLSPQRSGFVPGVRGGRFRQGSEMGRHGGVKNYLLEIRVGVHLPPCLRLFL